MFRFQNLIRRNAFATPDKIATHFEGRDFTWAAFKERIEAMSLAFVKLGVKPGDRVAFLGYNSHWLVEMYFAPCNIGAICVPMNYRLSEDEMVGVLGDCTPEILIVDRHFQDRATELMSRCPSLKHLIYADWDVPGDALPDGTLHYDTLIAQAAEGADDRHNDCASASDETMILFYTSGTTGQPKGVMLSHNNLLANSVGSGPLYGYRASDIVLLSGPLFHLGTGSRIYTSVVYATKLVIQAKFEVTEAMALIQNHKITTMTLVPTMLRMIMDHPEFPKFDFSSVRCLTYGAAPMPVALMDRAISAFSGVVFCQGYGMTETSPILSILEPADHIPGNPRIDKMGSIGKPVVYCDLRIVDESDMPVPLGQSGEIIVRGPQVMNGYWGRPEETAEAMRGGFYHTGDAGYLDVDGYLFIVGRTKEMIISGGENIYPIEIENCLSKHGSVVQCAVFGLPDPQWGKTVHAVVALQDTGSTTAEDLIAFCRDHIAHYKAPRGITIWDGPLPLSATNKIDKMALKALLLKEIQA